MEKADTLLDAGCGEIGLSHFVRTEGVTGVDSTMPQSHPDDFGFVCGSILELPFDNRSFSIVASVDALEHLPTESRGQAISELVRVARKGVLIAFPSGKGARHVDEYFDTELAKLKQPKPDWLVEHLQNPYPDIEFVLNKLETEAKRYGYKIRTKVVYSEPVVISRLIRWSAARSGFLFLANNLIAGSLLRLIPRPSFENSYRSIIVAEF